MELHGLLWPLPALDAALVFLREALGADVAVRDGARYAALAPQPLRVAFVAASERIVDAPALVVRVADLDTAQAALAARGASVLRAAESGPHERRAVLRLAGLDLVISQKTAAP